MLGFQVSKDERRRNKTDLKFTWQMPKIVANFLCKLLESKPFDHLKARTEEEEVRAATEGWKVGMQATKKMVEWCQDQWR